MHACLAYTKWREIIWFDGIDSIARLSQVQGLYTVMVVLYINVIAAKYA